MNKLINRLEYLFDAARVIISTFTRQRDRETDKQTERRKTV